MAAQLRQSASIYDEASAVLRLQEDPLSSGGTGGILRPLRVVL